MLAKMVNLALIGLFPLAWNAPLARAEVMWIWSAEEITVFSGIVELYDEDLFLCALVVLFAVVAPYVKTLALVYAQFSDTITAARILPYIEFLGRLAMMDVFILAFYVILYRGVADVQIGWGLYLFTGLVLASIWASWATKRARFRTIIVDRGSGDDAYAAPALFEQEAPKRVR